jgi:hypothetical protein
MEVVVIFRNNLNGFWDFTTAPITNVGVDSPKALPKRI